MVNLALLVGINKYEGGNNLLGCCNDVDNVHSILVDTLKFCKSSSIVTLKDASATRDNIVEALREMISHLKEFGGNGFFSFSGHGSQVVDLNGDEVDGKDEILCPHDMGWGRRLYITDDQLHEIFSEIPEGSWLEVLLDSCHSGTATRSSDKTFPSPYVDWKFPVRRMRRSVRSVKNHVLWTGCKDNQTSSDAYLGGQFNGAFTYFWAKNLRDHKWSRNQLLSGIRKDLVRHNFDQVPQLTVP